MLFFLLLFVYFFSFSKPLCLFLFSLPFLFHFLGSGRMKYIKIFFLVLFCFFFKTRKNIITREKKKEIKTKKNQLKKRTKDNIRKLTGKEISFHCCYDALFIYILSLFCSTTLFFLFFLFSSYFFLFRSLVFSSEYSISSVFYS